MAAVAVVAAGTSQNAAAYAFGLGSSNISDFDIATTGDIDVTTGNVRGLAVAGGGGDIDADSCTAAFGDECDTFAQVGDSTYANNDFVLNPDDGSNWALADGLVPTGGTQSTLVSASKASGSDPYLSSGSYELTQAFSVAVDEAGTLQFTFDATTLLAAELEGGAAPGSQGQGSFGFQITLNERGSGQQVFSWSPDGLAGGITGGTENADPFTLNNTLAVLDEDNAVSVTNGPDGFDAITDLLDPGVYDLSVFQSTASNSVFVGRTPEPASLSLIGLGLLGAGAVRARRKAKG
jgi:hypothetical protein